MIIRLCAMQLLELRGLRPATVGEVAAVHSYTEGLLRTVRERAPAAVADIGDPGEADKQSCRTN